MKIENVNISSLIPYENNPRKNDCAIEAVKQSIIQCGYIAPIIVDENMVVLAGHTRLMALQQLGYEKCEIVVKDGLSEEQKKKYRILDNKTNEFAEWDFEKLEQELADIDFDGFDFGFVHEEEFDETDLDDDVEKTNVTATLKINNIDDYYSIKERLQNLAEEIGATIAVKMS